MPAGTVACRDVRIGAPGQKKRQIVFIEAHHHKPGQSFALAPRISYDFETNEIGINIPVYVVRDEKGLFTGGLTIGWQSQTDEIVAGFLDKAYTPTIQTAVSVFTHNLKYLLIGFVLSIFYGAGAIFLIVYNASFSAAFIVQLTLKWANAIQLTGIALFHLLPESGGFILTAIAGATMSRAIIHEKKGGNAFKNVLQNAVKMLIIAIALILIAAFIETYVTATFFHNSI